MANKRLNATITIGGVVASSLKSALGSVTAGTDKIGAAVQRLQARQRELNNVIKQQESLGVKGSALRVQYANQELAVVGKQIAALKQRQALEQRISNAKQANLSKRAEARAGIFDAIAIGATIGAPIKSAVEFETAMLGVAKQVEGARDAGGKLTPVYFEMGKSIQQLAREIPLTTTELADMVTAGSRMGVVRDELLDFVRTSSMMAEAFELPAGELADNMGKIAGIFKIPIPQIGELADAINYLDDNAISKGSDIIKVLRGDLAGAATTIGLTGKNAAALASTFLTLGESAERADTAASGMMRELANAKMNPKRYQQGLKMIGMTAEQLNKGMNKDAQGTILKVLDKIKGLKKENQMEAVTRLFGKDWGGAIAKLAGGVDEYRRQIALANSETAKGSMAREFEARLQTTGAQAKLAGNQLSILSTNIGTVLLPAVNSVLKPIGKIAESMAKFAEANPGITKAVVGTAVAFLGLGVAGKVATYAFTFLKGGVLAVAGVIARIGPLAGAVFGRIGLAVRGVALAAAIAGAPIVAIGTALASAGVLVYKYWEPIKSFFIGFGQGVMQVMAPLGAAISDAFGPLGSALLDVLKSVWGWFTRLIEPITAGSELTKDFGSVGKMAGELIAGAFRLALLPIEGIVRAVSWLRDNIGGVIESLGAAWEKAKGLPGAVAGLFQSDPSAAAPTAAELDAASKPAFARLPNPRMASRGGGTVTDSSTHTYHITQQPGQDTKALADELERRRKAEAATRGRSSMTDGVGAQ